jgi:crossover junction endodeoxyribonuclease RuvC
VVVLGIDPGSRRCGYAAVARVGTRLHALESGVIVPGAVPLAERLAVILHGLGAVIARTGAKAVSVETAFCGASPRSALVLGQARGVALVAAACAGLPVFEYAPSAVKRAFTGNGRAGKPQMVRTARQLLGVRAQLADEADAVAIAVCHLSHARGLALLPGGGRRPDRTGRAPPRSWGEGKQRTAAGDPRRALARLRPSVRRYGAGA